MRGVPRRGGGSQPQCGFAGVPMEKGTVCRILPPGLRPSPLVNEGGETHFSLFHSPTASSSQRLFLGLEAWPLTQW